ncbi:hypothetical protein HOLleu_17303 [Holothuria leucospilota]|uniref:AAA+ ATPase domain-containing protein n=1 Tax=Holothuria leucospilota TaxID=206669 RepID=A0A9Q1C7C0_HOLLE|nr:hypothetical protein HOLleu_17303 [Holothuria leucospilota]
MALLRQRAAVISWDYLGKRDEIYPFQGNVHKSQALKFSLDITQQCKQLLFFYGEVGSGKTRLAKETARQLASTINKDSTQPLLYLFLVECEIYDKEGDLDFAEIQSQFAQTLKTFDERLSEELSTCKHHEFASKLSSYLSKRQQIFLFLLDGVVTNVGIILSFIENLISLNENVLLFVTSPTHLELPRLATKVSSYTCAGLTPEAARMLLNVVAGHLPELAQIDEEIVSLCHMNPFLITRVGQQMSKDSNFPYPPKDIRDLLNHSVGLAVSGANVPEKDDFFKRELELTRKLTMDMGRNMITILNQPEHSFSAKHVAETLKEQTPAVVKKGFLQSLE